MPSTQWKLWRCVVTFIATTMLTTTAVADDAKKDEAKPPQRQMLYKIFAPIMHDMGSCNLQMACAEVTFICAFMACLTNWCAAQSTMHNVASLKPAQARPTHRTATGGLLIRWHKRSGIGF